MIALNNILIAVVAVVFVMLWLRGSWHKRKRIAAERSEHLQRLRVDEYQIRLANAQDIIRIANEKMERDDEIHNINPNVRVDLGNGVFDGTASSEDDKT